MPRKNGLEALQELKQDDMLRKIPVVVFSTSDAANDVERAYDLGASCFLTKPNSLEEWCDKMDKLGRFWIECVRVIRCHPFLSLFKQLIFFFLHTVWISRIMIIQLIVLENV